jgi:hypothetical protein
MSQKNVSTYGAHFFTTDFLLNGMVKVLSLGWMNIKVYKNNREYKLAHFDKNIL